ncbi:hypothetical protein H072_6722 [Dactylellina haptotyla CBS 200.50]|uniref:Uncharacterized protein n=1 Tax=Dactylellina haptotyla (strain CBS 200.50) TaxID=1284197 RepID=S8BJL7_DACHA|nr:hypothetical protein H072_6722 [Dactylellina haptotyla CBS 200.50]
MPSFDELAVDIKFIILKRITDFSSLGALLLASKSYYNVYQNYKVSLIFYVFENELGPYKVEAYFIQARQRQMRNRVTEPEEAKKWASEYTSYQRDESQLGDIFGSAGMSDKARAEIVTAHRNIRKLCNYFANKELSSKRKEGEKESYKPATIAEEQRIIKAFYRVWLVYLLGTLREPSTGPEYGLSIDFGEILFKSWSFWEVMAVKVVKDFLWNGLGKWYTLQQQILLDSSESARGEDWQVLSCQLFHFFMLRLFPQNLIKWMEISVDDEEQVMALVFELQGRIGDFGDDAHPSIETSSLFVKYLNNGEISQYDPIVPWLETGAWLQTEPIRICKAGHQPFGLEDTYGPRSWVRPLRWRDQDGVDFKVCIWDDWRLENWGYVNPNFSSGLENTIDGSFAASDLFYWRSGLFEDVLKELSDEAPSGDSSRWETQGIWWEYE